MEEKKLTDAILVGVAKKGSDTGECEKSLAELERLLDTAGGNAFAKMIQSKESENPKTCIGSGKLEELRDLCKNNGIHLVVFDSELSPAQIRNIEDVLEDVEVIDRSMLILDIFALHATSAEGKLQVELAQLKYTAPRLVGKGKQLSRQEGRIGTRGPGESKLETDRRHLARRAAALEEAIRDIERTRATMRAARERSGLKKVAIVGYTNAGKSTLLNRLTDAGVLAENKLFATLDSTTRKLVLPEDTEVLISDTVGFIRKLPHHLIKAFKSTLDELKYADILVVLADASDDECDEQLKVTTDLIVQLGAGDKPILYVFNKADAANDGMMFVGTVPHDAVFISALTGMGIDSFLSKLENLARAGTRKCILRIPMSEQNVLNQLYRLATVENVDYYDDYVEVSAVLDTRAQGTFKNYIV
ncbi:MAG: GTPase HflX [Clostridia bacterium]|nr:GTPase HflX [Clostridia bacterium]